MENQKNNTGLYVIIGILLVVVILFGGYIFINKDSKTVTNDCDKQEVVDNNGSDNYNIKLHNNTNLTYEDFTITVDNGNIKFTANGNERVFDGVNAKYIYIVPYMDNANTSFYYITGDNELYYTTLFMVPTKADEYSVSFFDIKKDNYGIKIVDNVVGFIGHSPAYRYNTDGKLVDSSLVLNVLLNDGSIYNVDYKR